MGDPPSLAPLATAHGVGTTPTPSSVAALVPCHLEPPELTFLRAVRDSVGSVLVVDDGSPPATRVRLHALAEELDLDLLRLPSNAGKGHALAAGLDMLSRRTPAPDAVIVLDADGQHPASAIPALLSAAGDAELVVGDRLWDANAIPRSRRLANRAASKLLSLLTGADVADSQCGMRLLRGRALEIQLKPGGYEAETTHLKRCLREGVCVRWVPIPAVYAGESSSFRAVRDTVRVLRALLR